MKSCDPVIRPVALRRRLPSLLTLLTAGLLLAACGSSPLTPHPGSPSPEPSASDDSGRTTPAPAATITEPGDYDAGNGIVVTVPQTSSPGRHAEMDINAGYWGTAPGTSLCGFTVQDDYGHTWARVTQGQVPCESAMGGDADLAETDESRALAEAVVTVMQQLGWDQAGAGVRGRWYSIAFER